MSVRTMSLVFEYDMPELKTDDGKVVPDSTAKFVLLALADHANDEGEGAYPGVKRICKKTSMSSQTVCNALNALRHNGYTTLQDEKSKSGTNNYTINLEKFQPLGFQPLESDDSSCQNSPIPAARVKTSVNHQSTKKGDPIDGMLHFGKLALDRGEDKVEQVIVSLEQEFRANFPRTPKIQAIARFILTQQAKGETLDRFVSWAKRDEFNASRLYEYAEQPEKIRVRWPQAFASIKTPQSLEDLGWT